MLNNSLLPEFRDGTDCKPRSIYGTSQAGPWMTESQNF